MKKPVPGMKSGKAEAKKERAMPFAKHAAYESKEMKKMKPAKKGARGC